MLNGLKLAVCPLEHTFPNISSFELPKELLGHGCTIVPATASVPRELFSRNFRDFPRPHDESLGRRTDKVKREAGDERQVVTAYRFQDPDVRGGDDFNGLHRVLETLIECLEPDFVTNLNIAQGPKVCVSVTRQSDIAPFARQSRFR